MRTTKLCAALLVSAMSVTACKKTPTAPATPPPPAVSTDASRAVLVNALKDPGSVQWRNEVTGPDGTTLCGEINSKNSMGGYVGFSRFIANPSGFLIIGGKFGTWVMSSNRIPVPEEYSKAAELIDQGTWGGGSKDVYDWFWQANCG